MICAALGGRAAEELALGSDEVTNGAASDVKKAKEIAAAMAGEWAMGSGADENQDQKAILADAMEQTRTLLQENGGLLHRLAQALLQKETLEEEELNTILSSSDNEADAFLLTLPPA